MPEIRFLADVMLGKPRLKPSDLQIDNLFNIVKLQRSEKHDIIDTV